MLLVGVVLSHSIPAARWGYLALLFSLPFLVAGAKWSQPRRLADGGLFRWTLWTYVVTAFIAFEAGAATTTSSDIMGTGYWLAIAALLLLTVSTTWFIVLASRFKHLSRRERTLAILLAIGSLGYIPLLIQLFFWACPVA